MCGRLTLFRLRRPEGKCKDFGREPQGRSLEETSGIYTRVATAPILKGGPPAHLGLSVACHHCSHAGQRHLRFRVLSQVTVVCLLTNSPAGLVSQECVEGAVGH
jgi:hypothetical protein